MSSASSLRVLAAGAGGTVSLAPHVQYVQVGTPLISGPLGWEPAPLDAPPHAYAGNAGGGGQRIAVYRTVLLGGGRFAPGAPYRISDIQWNGQPVFEAAPDGPYRAWSPTEILLDAGDAGALARLREGQAASAASLPVEPDSTDERDAAETAAGEDDGRTEAP